VPGLRFCDCAPCRRIAETQARHRFSDTSATRQADVPQEYWDMKVGELANKAAQGDRKAVSAIKLIKQASPKAQKY